MWKLEHRRTADRRGLRYDSDLTDAEWGLVEPLIRPAKRGGRPRTVDVREVLNAIFYVLWTGCQWKALPKEPAAAQHRLGVPGPLGMGRHARADPPCALRRGAGGSRPGRQSDDGHPRQPDREGRPQRGASLDPSGYDAGKKVVGRKRHVLTDTMGLLLGVICAPGQRAGSRWCRGPAAGGPTDLPVRRAGHRRCRVPRARRWRRPSPGLGRGRWQIVRRCDRHRFVVLPKRWIVERTLAWISRCRRLARDYERPHSGPQQPSYALP